MIWSKVSNYCIYGLLFITFFQIAISGNFLILHKEIANVIFLIVIGLAALSIAYLPLINNGKKEDRSRKINHLRYFLYSVIYILVLNTVFDFIDLFSETWFQVFIYIILATSFINMVYQKLKLLDVFFK